MLSSVYNVAELAALLTLAETDYIVFSAQQQTRCYDDLTVMHMTLAYAEHACVEYPLHSALFRI